MANGRMSNSELSDSIKNYIKDMFDTNIKSIIEQHNTIIIDLKDIIFDLQTQIKNNNKHNDSNTILYSSMVTKNLDEIKCTINDTVTKNIENIYEDSNRKKTLIIYNIEEKKLVNLNMIKIQLIVLLVKLVMLKIYPYKIYIELVN